MSELRLLQDLKHMSRTEFERVAIEILKHAAASDVIDSLYKAARSDLPKIECKVCGYKGKTDEQGFCPSCGALMGEKEKPKDESFEHQTYADSQVDRATSVYEEDERGRIEEF